MSRGEAFKLTLAHWLTLAKMLEKLKVKQREEMFALLTKGKKCEKQTY